ncbi:NAD-P-binding protein [Lenzites betulinus]|nr:NAD-P-binding protein [Lenzites betulinus]
MSTATRSTTWLVTGANRGIGLELVRQLVATPTNLVVATARNPEKATELASLKATAKGTLHIVQLEVGDFDSIRALPKQLEPILGATGLDYLVNNAGIFTADTATTLDPEKTLEIFRVNVIGPALIVQALLPLLKKSTVKSITNVSSTAGSIATAGVIEESYRQNASYPISKSALNMLTYKQKLDLPEFTVLSLCPGWVQTDMGGQNALLKPEESVAGIIKVITSAKLADSGKFVNYAGSDIPW